MNGDLEISVDKLPIKRLEFIEEGGAERFPSYSLSLSLSKITDAYLDVEFDN